VIDITVLQSTHVTAAARTRSVPVTIIGGLDADKDWVRPDKDSFEAARRTKSHNPSRTKIQRYACHPECYLLLVEEQAS